MNWVRCLHCGTSGDAARFSRCVGCGQPYPHATGAPSPPLARTMAQAEARSDLGATGIALLILGLIGGFIAFTFAMSGVGFPATVRLLLIAGIGVGVGLGVIGVFQPKGSALRVVGKTVLGGFALITVVATALMAMAVGILMLLFIMCATGAMK